MYNVKNDCQISGLNEILIQNIGFKKNGTFVEVGAFDGESISNTCFLADIGWKGLYIEPVNDYYDLCVKRHLDNNVEVINSFIGNEEKNIQMYVAGDISTGKKEIVDFFNSGLLGWANGRHKGVIQIAKQTTLNKLLAEKKFFEIDLLVIDTEGNEWNVLQDFDLQKFNVKMMIIEMHETSHIWKSCPNLISDNEKINNKLVNSGYKKIFVDDTNTIFVK